MGVRYDVVVVGAGPAGSATATHLARGGARVLLCDRAAVTEAGSWRDKACGGGLTPRGVGAIERLKIDLSPSEAISVGGLEMVRHGRSLSVAFPQTQSWPSHGLVARRSVLDRKILDAAVEAGADLRHARVLGPLFADGVCSGVRVRANGSTEDVEAGWTIAADGATSAVARGAGLAPAGSATRGFWYAALRGYFAPVPPRLHQGRPVLEFYPLRTTGGRWLPAYGWVFPLPDGSANVGVDLPHAPVLEGCPPLREAFDDFVERLRRERPGFSDARLEEPAHGALLPEATRDFRLAAPGLLAVGDAAGMITPYSGEGIGYGLEAAELAAEAILTGESPSEVTRHYGSAVRDGYGFQFATSLRIMKAMRRPSLAAAAASIGFRSARLLRAAVRVMAYLVEDDPETSSTVSRAYRRVERSRPGKLLRS
jgi:geranylgeranyl reductase family protein